MEITVISSTDIVGNEKEIIESFLEKGVNFYHFRKPATPIETQKAFLATLPEWILQRMIISAEIKEFNPFIGGVHTQNIALSNVMLSASAHSIQEAQEKAEWADRVYISPVFPSISKENYSNPELFEQLKNTQIPSSWVALGGITAENAHQIKELGFKKIAVMGYVWQHKDLKEAVAKLSNLFK